MSQPQDQGAARLVGAVVGGRYRVRGAVSATAAGAVYEVEDTTTGAPAAMKVVLAGAGPEVVARFGREAKAMRLLEHPHVVRILDVGQDGDTLYIVSELVRGITLRALLDAGPLAPARALAIVRQVLEAVAHAHAVGVVHRDIEPGNILLVDGGQPGADADLVKLIDFGVARLVGDTLAVVGEAALTRAGIGVLGTPGYAAPELGRGVAADERADLYAVGAIAFELLAGRPPFADADPVALLRAHASAPVPTLGAAAPDRAFTPQLEHLVAEALAKEPAHRFRSAVEMIAALDAAVVSLELLAPAPAPPAARAPAMPVSTSTILGLPALPRGPAAATDVTVPEPPRPPAAAPVSTPPAAPTAPASPGPALAPDPVFTAAPGPLPHLPSAPIAARPARDPARARQVRLALYGVGACLAIALIAAVATRGGGAREGAAAATASSSSSGSGAGELARAEALLAAGDAAGANELLEREHTGPAAKVARLHLLLGHARFALTRRADALSAYERAIVLDAGLAADATLRANVEKALYGKDVTAAVLALELLASRIAPPARDVIAAQASTARADEVRRRARAIAERDGFLDKVDRVESYGADLKQATGCEERKVALHKLRVENDPRALEVLRRLKGKHACIEQELAAAIAQLEALR